MNERAVVHTTYIRTTAEQLWQALTDPAFTSRYWGVSFETDWKPGSTMVWVENGVRTADPEQVVLQAEPPRRLAYTWHTLTPEWAAAANIDEATGILAAAEGRTKATFEIDQLGEVVKLTVTHDDFSPNSVMLSMCGAAWPHLLSDLKTLLETGATLPHSMSDAMRG